MYYYYCYYYYYKNHMTRTTFMHDHGPFSQTAMTRFHSYQHITYYYIINIYFVLYYLGIKLKKINNNFVRVFLIQQLRE